MEGVGGGEGEVVMGVGGTRRGVRGGVGLWSLRCQTHRERERERGGEEERDISTYLT